MVFSISVSPCPEQAFLT